MQRMAKEFEGVGWDKAKGMARQFSSPWDMITANISEIRQVPGIGDKMATNIIREIHNAKKPR